MSETTPTPAESKTEQLQALSAVINDFIDRDIKPEWRIKNKHHMLWCGNVNSRILVAQFQSDDCEIAQYKIDDGDDIVDPVATNIHNGRVSFNPGGNQFKSAASRAGYDPLEDFFFTNVIPFGSLGGIRFSDDTLKDLIWIFNSVLDIIQPSCIITLGFESFKAMVGNVSKMVFEKATKSKRVFQLDDLLIVPLEDPYLVYTMDKKAPSSFFKAIDELFPHTHQLRQYGR